MQAQEAFLRRESAKFTEAAAGDDSIPDAVAGRDDGEQAFRLAATRRGAASSCTRLPFGSRLTEGTPRALTYEQCCAFAVGQRRRRPRSAVRRGRRVPDARPPARRAAAARRPHHADRGRAAVDDARPGRHRARRPRRPLVSRRRPDPDLHRRRERGRPTCSSPATSASTSQTRGLAVYRLLDAVVTLPPRAAGGRRDDRLRHPHRRVLPPGRHVPVPLPLRRHRRRRAAPDDAGRLAGFFTAEELAAGKGIVQTALDQKPMPGKRPDDWRELVPQRPSARSTPEQVDALRAGDLAAAFGADFAGLPLRDPATIPGRDAPAGRPRAAHRPGRRPVRPRPHPRRGRHPPRRLVPDLPLRRRPGDARHAHVRVLPAHAAHLPACGWAGSARQARSSASRCRAWPAG